MIYSNIYTHILTDNNVHTTMHVKFYHSFLAIETRKQSETRSKAKAACTCALRGGSSGTACAKVKVSSGAKDASRMWLAAVHRTPPFGRGFSSLRGGRCRATLRLKSMSSPVGAFFSLLNSHVAPLRIACVGASCAWPAGNRLPGISSLC